MNIMTQFNHNQKNMSSREIAELTEKRHSDVKRDCEVMFQGLGIDVRKFAHIYLDTMNRQQTEYLLDEELTMTLVTGYSIVLRNRVIKRWHELENQNAVQLPQTFAEALQLAADQARKIEIDKPKVEYYEKIVVRDTLLNATQVAQKLRMSAMVMNKYLDQFDVYSRGVKRARVFQQWFIDKGFGELQQTELGFSQPMFTTKGEAWVIEKLTSEGVVA